jgi:hypothetical protein
MRVRNLSASVVAMAVCSLTLYAPRGEACSLDIATAAVLNGRSLPDQEAEGVPTNARPFFGTLGDFPISATATLQRGDDEPAPVDVEGAPGGYRLTGLVLEPGTTYTAVLTLTPGADDFVSGDESSLRGELVFTTGDADDTTPPRWNGEASLQTEHSEGSDFFERLFPSTCGPEASTDTHFVTPPDLDEDIALVELQLVQPDGSSAAVTHAPPGEPLVHTTVAGQAVRYRLVAVDVAGNASEPLDVDVAGVQGFGCQAVSPTEPGLAGVALALGLWFRRRSRAQPAR